MKKKIGIIVIAMIAMVLSSFYRDYDHQDIAISEVDINPSILLSNSQTDNRVKEEPVAVLKTEIKVKIDNRSIHYNDKYGYPFIDQNGRTQVPFRLTLEEFGAKVTWDSFKDMAIVESKGNVLEIPIGQNYFYMNNLKKSMDTSTIIVDEKMYGPIRMIIEALGGTVVWDEIDQTVVIRSSPAIMNLPRSFDLRDEGRVTSVKDQGPLGTCWAFATLGALESSLLPNETLDLSENHMSLQHGFNLAQNDGGEFNMALAYLTRWAGPVKESDDPYNNGFSPVNLKAVKHLQEARIIPQKDLNELKLAVFRYGGVQSSIYTPLENAKSTSIYYNQEHYAYYYNDFKNSNHDVVIVGWDDAYPKENFTISPPYDGAFICKNSWGSDFGDGGYFYISYFDSNIGANNIVYTRIDDNTNYDNIYQTDILGWVGNIGYTGKNYAHFSNVYKTTQKENLRAVAFYATERNIEYEVYVVKNFTDSGSLTKREFITSGKLKDAGYYTIDFEEDIILEQGTKYAIVVKITLEKQGYPVAIEYNAGEPTKNAIFTDGEGYISLNGGSWERIENKLNSNICLKAFTDNIN